MSPRTTAHRFAVVSVLSPPATMISLARDHGVGSVGFYGGTPRDLVALLNGLQRAARVPLLNAANVEGGPGQHVPGATEFPATMAFEGDRHQSVDDRPAEYRR